MNSLLASASFLLFAPSLAAQDIEIASIVDLTDPPFILQVADAPRAFPGGGVLATTRHGNSSNQWSTVLRRISGDGDVLWSRSLLDLSMGDRPLLVDTAIAPDGRIALLVTDIENYSAGSLIVLDAMGDLVWTIPLVGSNATRVLLPEDVEFTDAGTMLVAGIDLDSDPLENGRANLALIGLDEQDGIELWRREYERFRNFQSLDIATSLSSAGAFATTESSMGTYVVRLDLAGNEVYRTFVAGPVPGPTFYPKYFHARPDGSVVLVRSNFDDAFGLDPSGGLTWHRAYSFPGSISAGVPLDDGGFLLNLYCCWVARVGEDGIVQWVHLSDGIGEFYLEITVARPDRFLVNVNHHKSQFDEAIDLLDADGNRTDILPLDALIGPITRLTQGTVADDGSVWYGVQVRESGTNERKAWLVQIVIGDDLGTQICSATAPNSTGATGRLRAFGSAVAADDDVSLLADGLPAGRSVLFLNGTASGSIPNPGGSLGDICLGGTIGRYVDGVTTSGPLGIASLRLALASTPNGASTVAVLAGQTWAFQAWHRDNAGGAQVSNTTSAIQVTFD